MKKNNIQKQLEQLDSKDLHAALDQLRRNLFGLRLNALTAHIKDYSQFKKLRKNIARIKTHLHAKENANIRVNLD
jgi:ribosomal protein L29